MMVNGQKLGEKQYQPPYAHTKTIMQKFVFGIWWNERTK